jgi:hypothetical protein
MNKQDEKDEAIAPGVRHNKQEGIDTTPQKVLEREQQGAEEQEEEHEQGTAKGKERGKYKQYEDSEVIIEKIRSYRTQRYADCEIMELLGNMPRRTYYNYVKKLQEQDKEIMEQWKAEHVEHVSEELMIYRETLCQKLRELEAIIEDKNTSAKDRMKAIDQYIAVSEKLVDFTTNGRSNKMKSAKLDSYSPF